MAPRDPAAMTDGATLLDESRRDAEPSVSIVIRNYNYVAFLPDALDSVLAQIYPSVEIVVVDDGSTDDSRTVLRRYEERCTVVLQENGGEGSALNAGFAAATGEIVMFLDSDDVLAPNAVSEIVSAWRPGVTRVDFPLYLMNREGMLGAARIPERPAAPAALADDLARFGEVPCGPQSSNAYAAWALRNILPLDAQCWRRAPDCYLNALTSAQGTRVALETPLGGYRIHASNLSHRNRLEPAQRRDVILLHARLYAAIRNFIGEERWRGVMPNPPVYHWWLRLVSKLVDPADHPYPDDSVLFLLRKSIAGIMAQNRSTLLRRLFLASGLLTLAVLPRALRRRALPPMMSVARATSHLMKGGRPRWVTPREPRRHWREKFPVPHDHD